MNQEKIGKFIAEVRKNKNMTQEELAVKLNVNSRSISRWETGKNMPDISLFKPLCSELDISINELLSGEHLKEKEIKNISEKNIWNVIKSTDNIKKRYKIMKLSFLVILIIILIITGRFLLIKCGYIIDSNLKYSQIYISNETNIKGNVNINLFGRKSIDFDIGANKYGYAVFKNPYKAFKTLKKDYSKGIKLIQKEFNLLPLTNFNYKIYGTYGWQVTNGTKEEKEQAKFVSSFMDIYENSFNK